MNVQAEFLIEVREALSSEQRRRAPSLVGKEVRAGDEIFQVLAYDRERRELTVRDVFGREKKVHVIEFFSKPVQVID